MSNTMTVTPGQSIAAAIGRAAPGDTIRIANGTYKEAVSISVSGTADKPITIAAENIGGVVIDARGLAFGINGVGSSHIKLSGLIVVDSNSGIQVNAALRVGANWIVEDVVVERAANCGIYIGGNDCLFRRTYANDCGQLGWWSDRSGTRLLDCGAKGNNTKKNNPAWEAGGVKFYITSNVTVDGGVWANNGGPAIWFDYRNTNFAVRNTEVHANHGWNQSWAGVGIVAEISEGPGVIENNYVHDNTGDGIAVWEAMNVTIRDNRLVNDDIGWRDMTNRAPYRTKNNTVIGNRLTNGQIKTPPANANNVVTELAVPTGRQVVPATSPAPPQPPSADGGTVPPSAALVDGRGIRWTLTGGKISRDGVLDGVTNGVDLLVIWHGALYQRAGSGWWKALEALGQWQRASDPRPGAPEPPATQPPPADPTVALNQRIVDLQRQVAQLNQSLTAARVASATIHLVSGGMVDLLPPAGAGESPATPSLSPKPEPE